MVCTATPPAVSAARLPRQSFLYQLIDFYYEDFEPVYVQRYQQRYRYWWRTIGEA
jgi:hypothetical protein